MWLSVLDGVTQQTEMSPVDNCHGVCYVHA